MASVIVHLKPAGAGKRNCVVLKHNSSYQPLCSHVKIANGIRSGVRVKQGQTIGYVGLTRITGPHLH